MSIKNLQSLIGDLHDSFSSQENSPEQQQLMQALQQLSHNLEDTAPIPPSLNETAQSLLEEIKSQHPTSASIIQEIIHILGNIGI